MCFTTVSSFIYYNDFIYYNNNKFIWAMTKFCLTNFVNLWCMHWLYCVYKIPAYDIINSYSSIIRLVFCCFLIILWCKLWLAGVFGMRMLCYTVHWSLWPRGDDERGGGGGGYCDCADFNGAFYICRDYASKYTDLWHFWHMIWLLWCTS